MISELAFRRTQNFGARLGSSNRQATFLAFACLSNWALYIITCFSKWFCSIKVDVCQFRLADFWLNVLRNARLFYQCAWAPRDFQHTVVFLPFPDNLQKLFSPFSSPVTIFKAAYGLIQSFGFIIYLFLKATSHQRISSFWVQSVASIPLRPETK